MLRSKSFSFVDLISPFVLEIDDLASIGAGFRSVQDLDVWSSHLARSCCTGGRCDHRRSSVLFDFSSIVVRC